MADRERLPRRYGVYDPSPMIVYNDLTGLVARVHQRRTCRVVTLEGQTLMPVLRTATLGDVAGKEIAVGQQRDKGVRGN